MKKLKLLTTICCLSMPLSTLAELRLCGDGVRECYERFKHYDKSIPARTMGYVRTEPSWITKLFTDGGFEEVVVGPFSYGFTWNNIHIVPIDIGNLQLKENFDDLVVKGEQFDVANKSEKYTTDGEVQSELAQQKIAQASNSSQQTVDFDVYLPIRIRRSGDEFGTLEDRVKFIVENMGGNFWYENQVQPALRGMVRAECEKLSFTEINANRTTIESNLTTKMTTFLKDTPFELTGPITLGAIKPAQQVLDQMTRTQVTQQQQLTYAAEEAAQNKRYDALKAQEKADKQAAKNAAISNTEVAASLTPELLELRLKELDLEIAKQLAGSTNAKLIFMGDGNSASAPTKVINLGNEVGNLP